MRCKVKVVESQTKTALRERIHFLEEVITDLTKSNGWRTPEDIYRDVDFISKERAKEIFQAILEANAGSVIL